MMIYILEVSICWMAFYTIYALLLSKETFFHLNRGYLVASSLISLAIPLMEFHWGSEQVPDLTSIYLAPIIIGVEALETAIIVAPAESDISLFSVLEWIYWTGFALFAFRLFYGVFQLRRYFKNSEVTRMSGYLLVLTSVPHPPFSFFKNLFWSRHFEVSEEERQNIYSHEEAHIFQWHSLDVVLIEALSVVFWCSPFIYFYKKSLKAVHEYLADEYVLKTANKKQYGHLLLRQSLSGPKIVLMNALFNSQLKKRIVMMTKNKSSRRATWRYLLILPLFAILFLAFSFSEKTPSLPLPFSFSTVIDTIPTPEEIFKIVEESPRFPGCEEIVSEVRQRCSDEKMLEFIYQNIRYPKDAKENGKEGMVVVRFVIEKDGSISNAQIVRSVSGDCDEEVLRVVANMPKWIPGKQGGRTVRVQYNLPVKFKLDGSSEKSENLPPQDVAAEEIFKIVEESPRFPGCEELVGLERKTCTDKKMLEFIYQNIKYPKEDRANGIQGMVVVSFIIEKDGSVTDAKVVRSISGAADEEVLRIVGMMPRWIPGKQRGRTVRVQFNLPVSFRLENSEPQARIEDKEKASVVVTAYGNAKGEEIFKVVEESPRFPGCEELVGLERQACAEKKMLDFIYQNIKYPKEARENGTEGIVVVKYIIEKDGSITNTDIVRSIGGGCDDEVIRVVNTMPKWIPGKQRGRLVRVQFNLPVKFKLDNNVAKTNPSVVQMDVYPNPAGDQVTVKFKASQGDLELRLIDGSGKIISRIPIKGYKGEVHETQFNSLAKNKIISGNYFISLADSNNNILKTVPIVIN